MLYHCDSERITEVDRKYAWKHVKNQSDRVSKFGAEAKMDYR